MNYYPHLLLMLLSAFGLSNCEKKCDLDHIEGEVHFFLIDTFERVDNTCQIDEATVVLKNEVFIAYEDISSYHSGDYLFKVSDEMMDKVTDEKYEYSVAGEPFAIVANNELVYTGYFWPSYSSLSCDWYTIDPTLSEYNQGLKVKMGYPGDHPDLISPDRRNDERILCIFERDGKLKD